MSAPSRADLTIPRAKIDCSGVEAALLKTVPPPFDQWVVIDCPAEGQALTAEAALDGAGWVRHGTDIGYMLSAVPPSVEVTEDYLRKYGPQRIRFMVFAGRQIEDRYMGNLDRMFALGFPGVSPDAYDAAWQLDAMSNYVTHLFKIIFYVQAGKPRHVVICSYGCELAIPLDVRYADE